MNKTPRKLILFDIDGTLVTMRPGLPHEIFERCMIDTFGINVNLDGYDFAGKTDTSIFTEIGRIAGLSNEVIEANLDRVMDQVGQSLSELLDANSLRLLPGVHALLRTLEMRDEAMLAVLTGNTPRGAQVKLDIYGLNHYFRFGVYGTESHDRNALAPLALQRANALVGGERFTGKDVIVIGDSIRDAACAKAIDARCIITLTGHTKREEFIEHEPDFFFHDLRDIDAVTSAIFNEELV